jgi:glycosyltransferase involved in cell wall biosynthesis
MLNTTSKTAPLVSVIIPCFNHGNYLSEAVESVWVQNYPVIEVIVVNDGSTDNTEEIAKQIAGIKYIYQKNKGLSAARNTGIRNSNAEFFIFLDADDWLLPGAIDININYLIQNEALAFVSGAHKWVTVVDGKSIDVACEINDDHYLHLLQGNYIGMHATVMYRRWVFDYFLFDETLKACEDYDLYLKIARKFPVSHHTHALAVYRIHTTNMSFDTPLMLYYVLLVLDRQKGSLQTTREKQAHKNGHKVWKDYYCEALYRTLLYKSPATITELSILFKYRPKLGLRYTLKKSKPMIKSFIKKNMPSIGKKWLHRAGLYESYSPVKGTIKAEDFNRLTPFSIHFGYDRGGPVDRYYIEKFLKKEAEHIKGKCLEIGDNEYSLLYGGNKLTQSDILHIDESNPKATFIGDLSNAPQLPDSTFDCIVLTQTLHLIYDFKGALTTCYRILKPGGVLLLTSPGITPIDHGEWGKTWYWSFTDRALTALIAETFPTGNAEIETFGNVYVATAFLYGMGIPEVPQKKMDYHDPHFQVIITVKAIKGPAL